MQYTYDIITQTLNSIVNENRLAYLEIPSSEIKTALESVSVNGTTLTIEFKEALDTADQAILDNIVALHAGAPYREPDLVRFENEDSSGLPIFALQKASGDFNTYISHNFCDNTTWADPNVSAWELLPPAGNVFLVDKSEVQFEHDLSLTPNTLILEYYAWVAPGVSMAVQTFEFKNLRDLIALGNDHYTMNVPTPELPTGITTLVFNYSSKLRFYGDSTPGSLHKLVVREENNNQITGSYATVGMVASTRDI